MVKCKGKSEIMQEEKKILISSAFMGELIPPQRRLKLKENHEVDLMDVECFFEMQRSNKIRELIRVICEIPEKDSEGGLRKNKEIEIEWKLFG